MNSPSLRQPIALAPLALGLVALAMVPVHVALFGVTQPADEGAAARIFQLLLAAQAILMVVFAAVWLPRAPRRTLRLLALQSAAAIAAIAVVVLLER